MDVSTVQILEKPNLQLLYIDFGLKIPQQLSAQRTPDGKSALLSGNPVSFEACMEDVLVGHVTYV